MAISTYGDITSGQGLQFIKNALKTADEICVLSKFTTPIPLDKNSTDTVKVSAPNLFGVLKTPMAEGVTPTAQQLTYRDVTATIDQYGANIVVTDKAANLLDREIFTDAPNLLSQQAAESLEWLAWQTMTNGNQVFYANGASRAAVNTEVSLTTLRKAVRLLMRNRARMIGKQLDGGLNIGTAPIEKAYYVFCHTDVQPVIRALAGFVHVSEYGSGSGKVDYEFGSVENMRFITTPMLLPFEGDANKGGAVGAMIPNDTTAANAAVYPLVILGENAVHSIALKGMNQMTPKVRRPGTPSDTDRHGQRGSVAIDYWAKFFITNEAWLTRVETAVTL
jgi:N4-gp56 family major capsid protein